MHKWNLVLTLHWIKFNMWLLGPKLFFNWSVIISKCLHFHVLFIMQACGFVKTNPNDWRKLNYIKLLDIWVIILISAIPVWALLIIFIDVDVEMKFIKRILKNSDSQILGITYVKFFLSNLSDISISTILLILNVRQSFLSLDHLFKTDAVVCSLKLYMPKLPRPWTSNWYFGGLYSIVVKVHGS